MQTVNIPNRNDIKKMVKEETDKQMHLYLKELMQIKIKLSDLESIIEMKLK